MQLFNEQQSMFNYLRNDLRKYKEVFQKAMEHETMYSPLTPTHQFSAQQLNALPKTNDGIVDLSSVMDEYREPFKVYEKKIAELEKALKESKATEAVKTNVADELESKYEKLVEQRTEEKKAYDYAAKNNASNLKEAEDKRDLFEA